MVRGEPVQTVQKGPPMPSNMQRGIVHLSPSYQPHPAPLKQPLLPSKQIYFTNSQQPGSGSNRYDYLNNTSAGTKYAELFINPSVNPNMYSFEPPMAAYPLDPVIPSYPALMKRIPHDQSLGLSSGRVNGGGGRVNGGEVGVPYTGGVFSKKASGSELENLLTTPTATPSTTTSNSPPNELENILKMSEADFTTLMMTIGPTNTDPQDQRGATTDFAIPSANSGIFDGFSADFFSEGGSISPSSSSPPSAVSAQPIDSWRTGGGGGGGANFMSNPLPIATSDRDSSSWSTSSPPLSSSHSDLTPLFEAFPSLNRDLPLPSSSSSSSPPPSHHHTSQPQSPPQATNLPLETGNRSDTKYLSFDEQLEFLDDSQNWDAFLPPMKRWQESPPTLSTVSSPVSHMHISPAPTPSSSTPPSPAETKPIFPTAAAASSDKLAMEKSSKPSGLLLGKSEDEILLKVMSQQLGGGHETKPVTREQLISMPVEEFNRLLDLSTLDEIETAFMKEWRRRGKNKTAAMIARKRKREELTDLDDEVDLLRKQKLGLRQKYDQLRREITALKGRTRVAEERVYQRYSQQSGMNVSRDSHVIHVDKTGKVLLGPRLSSRQMLLVK